MKLRQCIFGIMAAFLMLSCHIETAAQPKIKGPLYMADRVMSTNRISMGGRLEEYRKAAEYLTPLALIPELAAPAGSGPKNVSADYAFFCDMLSSGRGVEVLPLLFADGLYSQSDTLSFLRGRAAWAARQFAQVEMDMAKVPKSSAFNAPASLYRSVSLVCLDRLDEAVMTCGPVGSDGYSELRSLLLDGIDNMADGRRRSPLAAAAMSALIPGSGKIYAGNLREGVSALITVGALAGVTAECISKNGAGDWRSIGLAAVSGLFYAANIYGSYLSVSATETLIDNARKTAVLFTVGVPLSDLLGR